MSTSNPVNSIRRTSREQRQATAAAQRELGQLQREARRGLRSLRKETETTALVAGSTLAELAVHGINRLTAGLRARR